MQGNAARAAHAKLRAAASPAHIRELSSPVNINVSIGPQNQNLSTNISTMGSIAEEPDGDTVQDASQHLARAQAAVKDFAYGSVPDSVASQML